MRPTRVPVCPHSVSLKCAPVLCHCAQLCTGSGDLNSGPHAGVASTLPLTDRAVCMVLLPLMLTHGLSQTAGCCCCTWLARCSSPSVSVKRVRNLGRKAGSSYRRLGQRTQHITDMYCPGVSEKDEGPRLELVSGWSKLHLSSLGLPSLQFFAF